MQQSRRFRVDVVFCALAFLIDEHLLPIKKPDSFNEGAVEHMIKFFQMKVFSVFRFDLDGFPI